MWVNPSDKLVWLFLNGLGGEEGQRPPHRLSTLFSLCAVNPQPSGIHWDKTNRSECHANITAGLRLTHPQQYLRAAPFVVETETQYEDSRLVTEFSFFFLNFKKKGKKTMLTCKWPANRISENKKQTKEQNRLDRSFGCFEVSHIFKDCFSEGFFFFF